MTREEILQEFSDINKVYNNCTKYDTLKRMLDELTEPKTGHWIYTGDYLTDGMLKCSECGEEIDVSKSYYDLCPVCGAKMERSGKE